MHTNQTDLLLHDGQVLVLLRREPFAKKLQRPQVPQRLRAVFSLIGRLIRWISA